MTLLARAGKCDSRGASGLAPGRAGSCAKKRSCDKRPVKASPVKPAPASQRNSRRVRRQKLLFPIIPSFRQWRRWQRFDEHDDYFSLAFKNGILNEQRITQTMINMTPWFVEIVFGITPFQRFVL